MAAVESSRRLQRVCPACGTANFSAQPNRYSRDDWVLRDCGSCGLVYLENAVSTEALSSEFAWEKTATSERSRRDARSAIGREVSSALKGVKRLLRGSKRHVKVHHYIDRWVAPGKLLDVGCGSGSTLLDLGSGYVPYGIEISPVCAEKADRLARERGGFVVTADALSGMEQFAGETFSGVVMRAYLEHETSPAEVLERTARVLGPNGALIVKVPNYGSLNRRLRGREWCGFRFPDHVNYFTPVSLRRMIESAGFYVVKLDSWPTSDNMWLVARGGRV